MRLDLEAIQQACHVLAGEVVVLLPSQFEPRSLFWEGGLWRVHVLPLVVLINSAILNILATDHKRTDVVTNTISNTVLQNVRTVLHLDLVQRRGGVG